MRRFVEGDRLDDAEQLILNHSWVSNMPRLDADQLSELLGVLAPLYREEFRPTRVTPAQRKRKPSVSSNIPTKLRNAVLVRDGNRCQRCGLSLYGRDYSLQHRDPRGMGGSKLRHTMANLVALCGTATTGCHGDVESFRNDAKRDGWLIPDGVTPEEWPVLRFEARWEQPGDVWVQAEPHPRQIEMGAVA